MTVGDFLASCAKGMGVEDQSLELIQVFSPSISSLFCSC